MWTTIIPLIFPFCSGVKEIIYLESYINLCCITIHPKAQWLKPPCINLTTLVVTSFGCSQLGSSSGLSWGHSWGCTYLMSWLEQDDLHWPHSRVWRLVLTISWASSPAGFLSSWRPACTFACEGSPVTRTWEQKLQRLWKPRWGSHTHHFYWSKLVTGPAQIQGKEKFTPHLFSFF